MILPTEPLQWRVLPYSGSVQPAAVLFGPPDPHWTWLFVGPTVERGIVFWYWPYLQLGPYLKKYWADPELTALFRGELPMNVLFDYLLEHSPAEVRDCCQQLLPWIGSWDWRND